MGIFIKFEPDTSESIEERERRNYYKKLFTSEVYKKLYDSKKLDNHTMKIIYELLKEELK